MGLMSAITTPICEILGEYLIRMGQGTSPYPTLGAWPVFNTREPDSPDEVITLYDTSPDIQGRLFPTGEVLEMYGVQIKVRARKYETGWAKIRNLAEFLSGVRLNQVTVKGASYVLYNVKRASGPLAIGRDDDGDTESFTLNVLVNVKGL